MSGFIIQRCLQAVVVMFAMSVIVFVGVYAIGNPMEVLIPMDATQDVRDMIIARFGLDRPLWEQYLVFLGNVLQGDFGRSFVYSMPVTDLILSRLPATLELDPPRRRRRHGDRRAARHLGRLPARCCLARKTIMGISILGFSVPSFWVGLILILTFAVWLGWLPAGGRGPVIEVWGIGWSIFTLEGLSHTLLPAVNLALFKLAMLIRLARAGTREIMLTDTIKFARAAGLGEATIVRRHVLKLIAAPIVTVFGLEFGSTLAFAVVTETIFSWPGLGKLIIDSITNLDRPVMVAYLILVALLFVTINLVVDLTYAALDPRVTRGQAA